MVVDRSTWALAGRKEADQHQKDSQNHQTEENPFQYRHEANLRIETSSPIGGNRLVESRF